MLRLFKAGGDFWYLRQSRRRETRRVVALQLWLGSASAIFNDLCDTGLSFLLTYCIEVSKKSPAIHNIPSRLTTEMFFLANYE